MQDASGAAVTTVLKIMVDPKASAGTRLRAAEVVLDQGAQAAEIADILARVAELERTTGSAHWSRQRSAILVWPNREVLPAPAANADADNGK